MMKYAKTRAAHARISFSVWIRVVLIMACLTSCTQSAASNNNEQQIIQLSLNESPFGMAKSVKDSILNEIPNLDRYSAQAGERFIMNVAAHEGVETQQIIPGEILDSLGVYLGIKGGAGSEFIYSVPGYPVLVNAAARMGCKVVSIPLNNRLENDLEAIEAHINNRTAAIFLVNPHNPSGTLSDKKVFHDFLTRVSKRTLVIVDEAYLEYADDFSGRTAVNNLKEGDTVIVFRTLSKAYGLAGLSFGYAVTSKALAQDFIAGGWTDINALNRLTLAAAEAALKDQGHISWVNEQVTRERNQWHAFLDESGLRHTVSMANFVYFDAGMPHAEVQSRLKSAGIIIGRSFEPYTTWVRITIGLPEENARVRSVLRGILQSAH